MQFVFIWMTVIHSYVPWMNKLNFVNSLYWQLHKCWKKREYLIESISCFEIVWKLYEVRMKIRQKCRKHHHLVGRCLRQPSQYEVCTLDYLDMKLTNHYVESKDMCIFQNTDVFNLHGKERNREELVTDCRKIHQTYVASKSRTALAALAIEIVSFIDFHIIGKQDGIHATTLRTTKQYYSIYLLELQVHEREKDLSTLTSSSFKCTAYATCSVEWLPHDKQYMTIWTEIIQGLDMNNQDLRQGF